MTNVTGNPVLQEIISNVLFCFIQTNSHWYISNFIITVIWEIIMCIVDELVVLLKHNVRKKGTPAIPINLAQTIAFFCTHHDSMSLMSCGHPQHSTFAWPLNEQSKALKVCSIPMTQRWPHELQKNTRVLISWATENADDWESSINVTILNYLETTELLDQTTKYRLPNYMRLNRA